MAPRDGALDGASAVRAYGTRVGVAFFFAGLAFGVVFVVLGAVGAARATGASILAVAALVNAWRTVRRTPKLIVAMPRAEEPDVAYVEAGFAAMERAHRLSPPHGSRTFQ